MTLAHRSAHGLSTTRSLLNRLIDLPDLAGTIQALPPRAFAALVRKVGVEDAGELVALATTEQLVQAFDEDLFVSEHAGERESLDMNRFVVWLEILLEAGEEAAAARVAALDEDFVAHALSGIVLVLDEDALRAQLADTDEDEARQVDKALDSALTEDLDGYLLIARRHDGWDAALALMLALDRSHRPLLVRLLDRLVRVDCSSLEELSSTLTEGESLAEDVEAAREERRGRQGHVEARAARAFLTLSRKPPEHRGVVPDRDPLTRAYFRELHRGREGAAPASTELESYGALPAVLQRELQAVTEQVPALAAETRSCRASTTHAFMAALRMLSESNPEVFGARMEEFAYLMNVLLAGHERDGARLRPKTAADAVIATVTFGAVNELHSRRTKANRTGPSPGDFVALLRERSVDLLFRAASSSLARGSAPKIASAERSGLLYSAEELEAALTER